jgi:insertion element IS1 protein InsB
LAYVFGCRKDEVFLRLKALLEPFGLTRYDTDHWGATRVTSTPDEHHPGKPSYAAHRAQASNITARIKRVVRKTICFLKSTPMHDIVLGLFVNRYAFGRAV